MKILLISPLAPPAGGMATWTTRFLKDKGLTGHSIELVNTAIIGKRTTNFNKIFIYNEVKRNIEIVKALWKKLSLSKIDIVHINSACSPKGLFREYICMLILRKKHCSFVIHYHCDIPFMLKGKVSQAIFNSISRHAANVFVLNKSSQKYLKDICGINAVILPNFVSNDILQLASIPKKQAQKISNIVFVGHVSSQKGIKLIIEMARKFPNKTFTCVGAVSDEVANIEMTNNVIFTGAVRLDEVTTYMQSADVMLFPTHTEGFPYVVIEAMATGLPIITTPVGAIPDILETKGGILIDPLDNDGFEEAIIKLDNSILRREEMSLWAQKKVQDNYSSEVVVRKMFDIYQNIKLTKGV